MKKILIAEDNQEIGKMLQRAFHFNGWNVELVGDGQSAFDSLKNTTELPLAVIMDILMPKMSGIDLLRNMKEDARLKNIPVAVLTNSFLKENEKQFLELGANLYLVKIDTMSKDIVDKINTLVESQSIINNKK